MASPPDDKRKNAMTLKSNSKPKNGQRMASSGGRTKRTNGITAVVPSNIGHPNGNINSGSRTSAIKSAILASQLEKQKHEMRRKRWTRILVVVLLAILYVIVKVYIDTNEFSVVVTRLKAFLTTETNNTGNIEIYRDLTCDSNSMSCKSNSTNEGTIQDVDKIHNESKIGQVDANGTHAESHISMKADAVALEIIERSRNRIRRMMNPFRFVWNKFQLFLNRIKRPRVRK
jgi:hypothetical protein